MRQGLPLRKKRDFIALSVLPGSVRVLHLRAGWMGWRLAHEHTHSIVDADLSAQLVSTLQQCCTHWKIAPATEAVAVLAGDILGVSLITSGSTGTIPYSDNDILHFSHTPPKSSTGSRWWIHKDWADEFKRIFAQAELCLVELFSRAQLFLDEPPRSAADLVAVVETEDGQDCLHAYTSAGVTVRSCVLEGQSPQEKASKLGAELLSLQTTPMGGRLPQKLALHASSPWLAEDIPARGDWQQVAVQPTAINQRLLSLVQSSHEGICLHGTHEALLTKIKVSSLALGAVGCLALGLMIWHDAQLEAFVDTARDQARKELPQVETALQLRARTLPMAEAIDATKKMKDDATAIAFMSQVLGNFPPAPAALVYLHASQKGVEFSASGEAASEKWLKELPLDGLSELRDWSAPEELKSKKTSIYLYARPQISVPPASPTTPDAPPRNPQ